MIFGGTPQFLEDTRRGLFSYDALRSRLQDSKYSDMGYKNLSSPVIRLPRLSDNELLALVKRLTKLYQQREGTKDAPVSDEQIETFLSGALAKAGAEELITPREIIRDYLTLLNILRDNPDADFDKLIAKVTLETASEATVSPSDVKPVSSAAKKVTIFDIDI